MTNNRRQRAQRAEQMRLEREKADKRRRLLVTIGVIGVAVVLVAVAAFAINSRSDDQDFGPLVEPQALTDDGGIVYDQQGAIGKSAGEATPVDVVLFVDFQCPICKVFEEKTSDFLDQQVESGAITLEFRPQSFLDRASDNEYSSRALGAAMCVNEEKGAKAYKDFSDLLFADQPEENTEGPTDAELADYAEQAGAPEVRSCITDRTYQPWAKATEDTMGDNEDSAGTKVQGTPTIWVDGKAVEGPDDSMARVQDLEKALTAAQG